MKTDTHTIPASVAARLTDREIEWLAAVAESGIEVEGNRPNTAAVLRDYVRLRAIEYRIDSAIKKNKEEWDKAFKKCSKCKHAINGRPRSFRGEPCYWHIRGCEDMEYVDESNFRSKLSLLRYIKRGNQKSLLAEAEKGETK